MKIIFALLCKPELAGAACRQIGAAAQVALGAVGPVLEGLETRGFLGRRGKGAATSNARKNWQIAHEVSLQIRNGRKDTASDDIAIGRPAFACSNASIRHLVCA